MKPFMVTLILIGIMVTSVLAEGYPEPPRQVVDKYGNRLTLHQWTKFQWENRFRHPNGNLYPLNRKQTTWVLATPYRQNKFHGWMTVAGFAAGTIDGYNQRYLQNGWDNWDEVERFYWFSGNTTLWGLALDSGYPDACRWMGGFQGGLVAISILKHSNRNGLETISLAAGAAVGSYVLGWLFDEIRTISERNTYRYRLQHH